ncbi:MAG: hypothetical protein IJ689_02215 [Alphaproteobacteria bacterium]|nr:hypothetical protein [Alphaproteobacteria bacterium]
MNKYILLLGVASVALGSYAAYAGNSATMTVTATIAYDMSLTVGDPINLGTITINPSINHGSIPISEAGVVGTPQDGIMSLTGFTAGTFTANVPDSCKVSGLLPDSQATHPCFMVTESLSFDRHLNVTLPYVTYVSGNQFRVHYRNISYIGNVPAEGDYSKNITIEYYL